MLNIQNYRKAESLEEAYELNQKRTNRVLGGMLWLRLSQGNVSINTAIDLSLLGLDKIEEKEDEFVIGSMVTLRQLETHKAFNEYTMGAMKESVKNIVGVQFRNLATIGGSIYSRFGFSDLLTLFLAMDAYVVLYKSGTISLKEYAYMKYDRDILVSIIVKKKPIQLTYGAVRNSATDIPVLNCAVSRLDGAVRAVVGARPGKAMIVEDEKGILSDSITEEGARAFAEYAADKVPTDKNSRGTKEYRAQLVKVLVERGVLGLKN